MQDPLCEWRLLRLECSFFANALCREPLAKRPTWSTLLARFAAPVVRADIAAREGRDPRAKLALPAWSPTIFAGTRSGANARTLSAFVLDYDAPGLDPQTELDRWAPWCRALHSSWSSTATHQKFRIVVPFARPVAANAWPAAWRHAVATSGGRIDKQTSDVSRIYFLPFVKAESSPYLFLETPGDWLDPWFRPDPPKPKPPPGWRPRPGAEVDRRDIGERLGRVAGGPGRERAEDLECPGCGRASVFFWIDPEKDRKARCEHRNSCGWEGYPENLAR